jgi:hypothetical protein
MPKTENRVLLIVYRYKARMTINIKRYTVKHESLQHQYWFL